VSVLFGERGVVGRYLVSTGGLTGLIVKVFHSKKNAKVLRMEECSSKEK
jgi:hypothetical protein